MIKFTIFFQYFLVLTYYQNSTEYSTKRHSHSIPKRSNFKVHHDKRIGDGLSWEA